MYLHAKFQVSSIKRYSGKLCYVLYYTKFPKMKYMWSNNGSNNNNNNNNNNDSQHLNLLGNFFSPMTFLLGVLGEYLTNCYP